MAETTRTYWSSSAPSGVRHSAYTLVNATPEEWVRAGLFWLEERFSMAADVDIDYRNLCWRMAVRCFGEAYRRGWSQ